MTTAGTDRKLLTLFRAIASGDGAAARRILAAPPHLAKACIENNATRQTAKAFFPDDIRRQVYAGDTALHVAAAAYEKRILQSLIKMGADVRARNRRGAEPLHSAAVGSPGTPRWKPGAQIAAIAYLIEAGADPNAGDKSGVTPLHRAVRTRCAAACRALLERGADARQKNNSGSIPMVLATFNTGRSGSGLPEAKAEQREIIRLLQEHDAARSSS
jgi:ankyrin repeat protein